MVYCAVRKFKSYTHTHTYYTHHTHKPHSHTHTTPHTHTTHHTIHTTQYTPHTHTHTHTTLHTYYTHHTHTHTHHTTQTHTHTHTHTHIHVDAMYLHVTKPQDVQQVTNTQIHTTVTKQNTINPVQNNKTQSPLHINSSSAHRQQCAVWYLDVAAVLKFCFALPVTIWWR